MGKGATVVCKMAMLGNDRKCWAMLGNDGWRKVTTVVCRMTASAGGGRARLAHAALRHLSLFLQPTLSDDQNKTISQEVIGDWHEITEQLKSPDHMVATSLDQREVD